MTPWQLAKDSESSHQMALFCFAAKACLVGFKVAMQPDAYTLQIGIPNDPAVPELKWFHSIPNGGSRGDTARSRAIAGGTMKAEGVKAGVLDCFWPLVRPVRDNSGYIQYCGLYIEMKKPTLKNVGNPQAGCSNEQKDFGQFCINQGYSCHVCYTWLEAAEILEWYYNL